MRLPISIVITTIGEDILDKNIANLTGSKYYFDEILIVIPNIYKKKKYEYYKQFNNIKFIYTDFKGQVNQRIFGFKNSKNKHILQLDCDCIINPEDIHILYSILINMNNDNSAIAPVYFNDKTKIPIHKYDNSWTDALKNILTYIICGSKYGIFKMGTISKIGNNYGVDPNYMVNELYPVEWLPGGCILHSKKNIIVDNYYPFTGKAYCEDLIHSYHLRNKKINLYVSKKSSCYTEIPYLPSSYLELNKYLSVQKYFTILLNKKVKFGFYIWMYLTYLRYIISR